MCTRTLKLLFAFYTVSSLSSESMSGEHGPTVATQREDAEESDKNWPVVLYEPTQNFILASFYEERKTFRFSNVGDDVIIMQDWNKHGVAAVVWEAAIELGRYISENLDVGNKTIIELGAGTGLVGIICAKMRARVMVTDLKEALPFLSKNMDLNFDPMDTTAPEVRELKWGTNLHAYKQCEYDYVIGADVIYNEDAFDDLHDTLCYLAGCKQHPALQQQDGCARKPIILLSCKMRYTREAKFIKRMKRFFIINEISKNNENNIHIYQAVAK